jgi:outer membrane lipoprotein-sorting protein
MPRFAIALFSSLALLFASPYASAETATEILKKADEVGFAKNSRMKMVQTVVTPSGDTRSFKIIAYSENGAEKGLTIYVSPKEVKGMKILSLNDGDDIWSYFPRTNRTRKLASSARNRKVQGSDFTYDDMAGGKMAKKWQGTVAGSEVLDGKECFKLELTPTESGPQSYSRITAWVNKADYTTVRVEYYDLDGDKLKRLDIKDYRKISGVLIPFEYVMTNLLDGGKTSMKVAAAEVNLKLDPGLFNEASLSK